MWNWTFSKISVTMKSSASRTLFNHLQAHWCFTEWILGNSEREWCWDMKLIGLEVGCGYGLQPCILDRCVWVWHVKQLDTTVSIPEKGKMVSCKIIWHTRITLPTSYLYYYHAIRFIMSVVGKEVVMEGFHSQKCVQILTSSLSCVTLVHVSILLFHHL